MRGERPSLTARWIAAQRARQSANRPVIPTGDLAAEERLYAQMGRLLALPGLRATAMDARTAFFDAEVMRALERGVAQMVIVGAGYDGRPLRFRQPGVHWIEIDHPATQRDKLRRLRRASADLDGVSFAPVDLLAGDVRGALASAGFVEGQAALFLCEGLFSYLPPATIHDMCAALHAASGPRSTLVANSRVTNGGPLASDLVLRVIGEQRRAAFGPGDLARTVSAAGWTVARTGPSADGAPAQVAADH